MVVAHLNNHLTMSHRTTQVIALVATIVMFALQAMTFSGVFGPNPVGTTSNDTAPMLVPASYAFAIWTPIYLGLVIFPLFQLIKNRSNHSAWIELRYWYTANVIGNGLWLVAASYDWQWITVGIIVFMLVSLFRINQLLIRIAADGAAYSFWAERIVFSLYFAWITLATVLNVSSALHFYDWSGWGVSEVNWTLIIGVVAIAITAYTALKFRDFIYPFVVVWAFVALAVKHYGEEPILVALAAVAIAISLGVSFLTRPTDGARTQVQGALK